MCPNLQSRPRAFHALVLAALLLAACGGGATTGEPTAAAPGGDAPVAAGDPGAGKIAFTGTCTTCHGADAMGLPGLGKQLVANAFVAGKTDAEMVAFLKTGRPASDPLNTTKVDMPPKGGNPAFTDEDLTNIVAYLRSLQ